ncbi:hypothetical protein [Raoultibacter phocaeensis]|uniref:hypothetical protein n=1 Tax=Raoultibacter phocaeensis TaxID=2479841 RepID=UPI0015D61858|nr:hypothetical protein [Raoultibacter phocaeensis]
MLPFVPSFIPNLMQAAPFVIAFSILCAKPLRKHAGWFYAFWTVAVVSVTWFDPVISLMGESAPALALMAETQVNALSANAPILHAIVQLITSSFTGVCFYFIVMFIGAFERTPMVKRLLSVRSQLSVIGGIVIMGHLVRIVDFPFLFANPMWAQIWGSPAVDYMFIAAVIIGPLLTLTFLVPWITSFKAVRTRMSPAAWKKTQLLAYPFMALMVAQGFFLALGHAVYGFPYDGTQFMMSFMSDPTGWLGTFAQQVATAWMYLALGIGYLVLRLRKCSRDKARRESVVASVEQAGAF